MIFEVANFATESIDTESREWNFPEKVLIAGSVCRRCHGNGTSNFNSACKSNFQRVQDGSVSFLRLQLKLNLFFTNGKHMQSIFSSIFMLPAVESQQKAFIQKVNPPGCGHCIKNSKLMTLALRTMQIDALWGICIPPCHLHSYR